MKIQNLEEFIKQIDDSKKDNKLDLSSDQDLAIGIMNLIAIEEHLFFTGAKTKKDSYYDLINQIREMRKNLLKKIIVQYEGEVWCISKHLLSSSMRLMEVGTKALSKGNNKEAYDLFNQSYELYCIFWGLNMNLINEIDLNDLKFNHDKSEIKSTMNIDNNKESYVSKIDNKDISFISKLKSFVSKATNCCKE